MKFFIEHGLSKSYKKGTFFNGENLSLIDFHIYPFLERYNIVAKHYLKFDFTKEPGLELLAEYFQNMENHQVFIKSKLSYEQKSVDRTEYLVKGYNNYYKE